MPAAIVKNDDLSGNTIKKSDAEEIISGGFTLPDITPP